MGQRDSLRQKVYKAERVVDKFDEKGLEFAAACRMAEEAIRADWFCRAYGKRNTPRFKLINRRRTLAYYWALHHEFGFRAEVSGLVVCHELAHTANSEWHLPLMLRTGRSAHGLEFCAAYVHITRMLMGEETANALRSVLRGQIVKLRCIL